MRTPTPNPTPRRKRRGTTASGYGSQHRALRAQLVAQLNQQGSMVCPRCLRLILPGMAVDLGHLDDRTGYQGLEHEHCNRSAGAAQGNRRRGRRRRPVPVIAVDPRRI